jgi:hypothetical protein
MVPVAATGSAFGESNCEAATSGRVIAAAAATRGGCLVGIAGTSRSATGPGASLSRSISASASHPAIKATATLNVIIKTFEPQVGSP